MVIQNGVVIGVGAWGQVEHDATSIIEVDGVLTPGFVDAHSHLRGLPLDDHGLPARQFESWICSLSSAASLDPHDEAVVAAVGLVQTGVTAVQGFVDVGAREESAIEGAQAASAGVASTGIRALLVLGFADRALTSPDPAEGDWALVAEKRETLPTESVRRIATQWLAQPGGSRIRYGIGPIGAQWSTDALLEAIAASAGAHRLHTHLHESRLHRTWLTGSASPLERLRAAGLLVEQLSGAHAVHLLDEELDLVAQSRASLVHCPLSNSAMRVGSARISAWLSRGIPAGLGIDSQNVGNPDMFEVMRAAIETARTLDEPISEQQVFAMATTGGARALGWNGGRVAVGLPADLVAVALDATSVEGVVAEGSADAVQQVWVGGESVVVDGRGVVDTSAPRARLQTQLAADAADRRARIAARADLLDRVEKLAGARA